MVLDEGQGLIKSTLLTLLLQAVEAGIGPDEGRIGKTCGLLLYIIEQKGHKGKIPFLSQDRLPVEQGAAIAQALQQVPVVKGGNGLRQLRIGLAPGPPGLHAQAAGSDGIAVPQSPFIPRGRQPPLTAGRYLPVLRGQPPVFEGLQKIPILGLPIIGPLAQGQKGLGKAGQLRQQVAQSPRAIGGLAPDRPGQVPGLQLTGRRAGRRQAARQYLQALMGIVHRRR